MPPSAGRTAQFQHRRPLIRRDLAAEREYPAEDAALQDGVRALVIAPLIARGRVIGTLAWPA